MRKEGKKLIQLETDISALSTLVRTISSSHEISVHDVFYKLQEQEANALQFFPSSILRNKKLGILQAVVKYLREHHKLRYRDIARLLKRNDRIIWVTYNNAKKNYNRELKITRPNQWLPLSLLVDSDLGPLESIVRYLHDQQKMTFAAIGKLLDRDNRVVWAVYHKKRKHGH